MAPTIYRPVNRPLIRAMAATGIEPFVRATDVAFERVLDDAAIDGRWLIDPLHQIELFDYCRLIDTAALRTSDPAFGAKFGRTFVARHFGPVGYLVINSPTLGDGLAVLSRYYAWIQENSTLSFRRLREFGVLEYQIYDGRVRSREQDAELTIAALCGLIRCCTGPHWVPAEVHFEHDRVGSARDYWGAFQAPVYFSAPSNRILIDARALATSIPSADPYLFAAIEGLLRAQMTTAPVENSAKQSRDGFVATVSYLIERGCREGSPSIDVVAREMGLTIYRLRRDLRLAGLPFDDLVNSVRRELAMKEVATGAPLTEVAFRLGYSDLSAFSRAFRRWTGRSPSAYRRSRQ